MVAEGVDDEDMSDGWPSTAEGSVPLGRQMFILCAWSLSKRS